MIRVLFATPAAAHPQPGRACPADIPDIAFEQVRPAAIGKVTASLRPHVLWIDAESRTADLGLGILDRLEGMKIPVLLTRAAVPLAAEAGWASGPPPDMVDRIWRNAEDELFLHPGPAEAPRMRGHACFRRHRLFGGSGGGTDTWWPREGERFRAWTWHRPRWHAGGRVIAVERAFMRINPDRATIWEYPRTADRPHVLCIGAYLPVESADPLIRPRVNHLLNNTFLFLAGRLPTALPDLHWEAPNTRTLEDDALDIPVFPSPPPEGAGRSDTGPLPLEIAPLRMAGAGGDGPFTVAGRRALVAGREDNGAEEIWMHPLRVTSAMRLPGTRCTGASVTPLGVERTLQIHDVRLTERIFVPGDAPAAIFEYQSSDEPDAGRALDFRLEWITDLRLMGPYPADSTGPLQWRTDGTALVVRSGRTGESVRFLAAVFPATIPVQGTDSEPHTDPREPVRFSVSEATGEPDSASARLQCSLTCGLRPGDRLRVLVAASVHEADDPGATLRSLLNATSLVRARAATLRRTQLERLSVRTADEQVGLAIEWAKARLDSYRVETPGVGRSLVAAYSTSRSGWNDGRTRCIGYPGQDSVWTALAALACGDFEAGRDVISFLGQHQDVTGKILHECTTSGFVRYEPADATPLYLLLVARYFAWTGDANFVRSQWERVQLAFEFSLLTDRDGDGPDSNASVRTAARRELAVTAESIGNARLAAGPDLDPARFHPGAVGPLITGRGAWDEYSAGRSQAAFQQWHANLDPAGSATMAVSPFVYGLLGAQPDAHNGRLRLRPQIPDTWISLQVRNLRMGQASLSLHFERTGNTLSFTLEQDEGAVPVRVILEPALPRTPTRARVDGRPAHLDTLPFGERIVVPVQLVLDHARVVEIDLEPPS